MLANFDLNSSQKSNKIKTETKEKEGHKSKILLLRLALVKGIIIITHNESEE